MIGADGTAALQAYFRAEKHESLLFVAVGLLALAISAWALFRGGPARGLVAPVLSIGLIQLIVGASVYLRTDAQVTALLAQHAAGPAAMAAAEIPRMDAVMRNFRVYKAIEIAVCLGGMGFLLLLRQRPPFLWAGWGMAGQGILMLVLDLFAEARGQAYMGWLKGLS